ncbi:hypothetical protein VXJ24_10080, partial [Olsenella sp. YH-ols2221]|uniref:hypothetical protein n=1 Tax=Olsenella kribbiana TaxID=3115221 RepID=UPI002ED98FB6
MAEAAGTLSSCLGEDFAGTDPGRTVLKKEKGALRWFLWERFRHRPSSAGENNDLELKRPREGPFPRHPPM